MKPFFLPVIYALCLSTGFSQGPQQKCSVESSRLPLIRGFKLGMTTRDAGLVLPDNAIWKEDEYGWGKAFLLPAMIRKEFTEGLRHVALEFYLDHLVSVEIDYDGPKTWRKPSDFDAIIAQRLDLPANAWELSDAQMEPFLSNIMKCEGFNVQTSVYGDHPSLKIWDPSAIDRYKAHKEDLEDKRRRAFKP
jgi:hypothetical protein